jgi:hypothetical protein
LRFRLKLRKGISPSAKNGGTRHDPFIYFFIFTLRVKIKKLRGRRGLAPCRVRAEPEDLPVV